MLSVVLNGRPVHSYNAPFVENGRVMAPVEPFVTSVAASIGYSGGTLVVTRGDRFAQVPFLEPPQPAQYPSTYVAIGPLLRTLGANVWYDGVNHCLYVETPRSVFATPTPFNPAVPQPQPTVVFTPPPSVTPAPAAAGTPFPRRTPIPVIAPTPWD
jgi:hypothetical protein